MIQPRQPVQTGQNTQNDRKKFSFLGLSAMDWWFVLLILYIPLDISLAILFIGFYQPGWTFDASTIYKYLFAIDGYEFTKSPVDFAVLAAFRLVCLSGSLLFFHFLH